MRLDRSRISGVPFGSVWRGWPVTLATMALACALILTGAMAAQAQAGTASPQVQAPAKTSPAPSKPEWGDLTTAQQAALAPLQPRWNAIGAGQKRKWIALSENYGKLSRAEQATLHERMAVWSALGTDLRSTARLNFAEAKALPSAERKAQWEAYQALSPEERRKLTSDAAAKPPAAARAVKPVAPEKLAAVPTTRSEPGRPIGAAPAAGVSRPPVPRPAQAASKAGSSP